MNLRQLLTLLWIAAFALAGPGLVPAQAQPVPGAKPATAKVSYEQKRLAEASRLALQKTKPFKGEIVTEITKAAEFYAAEGYHQDYYQKNPARYEFYKSGCGREARL